MKRILVTSAGGRLAVAFTRALRSSPEEYTVIGADADNYGLQRAETDTKILIPRASDPNYIDALNWIIDKYRIDLVTVQLEAELLPVSEQRNRLNAPVYLPDHNTMVVCDDKWASYEAWEKSGVPVPESILISDESDLASALDRLGGKMWLRSLTGAGGKGSLPVDNLDAARKWVDMWNGWGDFMAAQLLTKETSSWESVWDNGRLVAAQTRKRLRWEFSKMTPSGVTGITGASETVTDPIVEQVCARAVCAVDRKPHGIMGVDVSFDEAGKPYVTEINSGRFMSGGVILFANHGANFPYFAVKAGLGESTEFAVTGIDTLEDNLVCVRGLDVEPVITHRDALSAVESQYGQMMSEVRSLAGRSTGIFLPGA